MGTEYHERTVPVDDMTMKEAFAKMRDIENQKCKDNDPYFDGNYDNGTFAGKLDCEDLTKIMPPGFEPSKQWRKDFHNLNPTTKWGDPYGYKYGGFYFFFGNARI